MSVDVESFVRDDDSFALRFARDDLPGLLSKRLEVPRGWRALIKQASGENAVLGPGGVSNELEGGVLVRERCRLDYSFDAGRSRDNLPFDFEVRLVLAAGTRALDLTQLERSLLAESPAARTADVHAFFAPYLKDAVRFFVAERDAEDLGVRDQREALNEHLRESLGKGFFETGLQLDDVVHPVFRSSELDERLAREAEAQARAEELARERELLKLKKGLDKEALLMDIEVRDEADRHRRERRLQRFEELRAKMGDDDAKALVMMLDDDRQRAALIRELIEKDLTPEQRSAVKLNEMEARVEERLRELQEKLAQLTGAKLRAGPEDPVTRRVVCVVGKRLLAFDPKTNLHPEVPKEVYDTEGGALGYLRSVRNETIDGEDYLLAGAQRGVYKINGILRTEYHFPREPKGKGGANSVCYFDGRIYATHSEIGLVEWPLDGSPGRILCVDAIGGASSVRGACMHRGLLYFSAGSEVLCLDVATGSEVPTRFRGSDDSITSFLVSGNELLAGNRSGKLYRWSLDDPGSPEAFGVIKKNPIYMLREAVIAGQRFFVIGSKDYTVTVAEPRKDLYREYQAREEVRWVDGAADFVFGVSRSGYKVFCWDALKQSAPALTIRVSDKIQDLFVIKTLPAQV